MQQTRKRGLIIARTGLAVGGLFMAAGCFVPSAADDTSFDPTGARAMDATCPQPDDAESMAGQVFELINLERAKADLPPVVRSMALDQLAEDYACRMVVGDFFAHDDPTTGKGPAERAEDGNYKFVALGENLAAGQETPAEVMQVWMESPAHREIILDEEWTEVGIGIRSGGDYSIYWVQEFALPSED